MKIFVVTVFLLTYGAIVLFNRKVNPLILLFTGVGLLLVSTAIGIKEAFSSINFNVLGVFLGTMVLSGLFIYSNVPALLATRLVARSRNVGMALLLVCLLAGFISLASVLAITNVGLGVNVVWGGVDTQMTAAAGSVS